MEENVETPPAKKASVEEWTRRITEEEMPIFGHTVQQVITVAEDDEAPSVDLARVVLQDASMTARVLKLANSIFYNPRNQNISTVSRAVVILGFNTVRNMCLSIALVESLVHGPAHERLTRELARSIHAAVQARSIAVAREDDSPEEVFIATLLYRLGDLAFWCFSGELGKQLDALLRQPGYTADEAQQEVLGFRLPQLTASLVKQWQVNELLNEMLQRPKSAGDRGRSIVLCHRLAEAAEKGWNSPEVQVIIQELARLTGRRPVEITRELHGNAREAAEIAGYYGASTAAETIPLPSGQRHEVDAEEEAELAAQSFPEPDGMLQLKILRELAGLLQSKDANFNLIMELVMEGMYRGVGMDRVLFALLTPDRRALRAKFMFGKGREELMARFNYTRHPKQPNIFFDCVDRKVEEWADTKRSPELGKLVSTAVTTVLGRNPFFAAPIVVTNKSIGIFVADRSLSGRSLDEEAFEGFKYFVQQAGTGLTLLTSR